MGPKKITSMPPSPAQTVIDASQRFDQVRAHEMLQSRPGTPTQQP
jgi:hypothetical protein